jgi:early growth response protein 1
MLLSDRESIDEDPFIEVYKLLNSIEATIAYCPGSSPILQHPDSERQDSWLLSHRSTDVDLSVDENMSEMAFPISHSSLAEHSLSQSAGDYDLVPSKSHSPTMLGPFPDINMFDLAYMNRVPDAGINPADIMGPIPTTDSVCIKKRSISPPNSTLDGNSPTSTDQLPSAEVLNSIVAMLSNTAKKEDVSPQGAVLPVARRTTDKRGVFYHPKGRIMNEFAIRMGASKQSTNSYSPDEQFAYRLPTPTVAAYRSPLVAFPFQYNQQAAFTSVLDCGSQDASEDSPVLNAHLGIDLTELMDKADKYRARFPGRAIDKKWLMAYAGKLTKRGELLEDYRCYVNGCTQKNKRRDHILVHVGSHVDQRLFVCSVWCVKFETCKSE